MKKAEYTEQLENRTFGIDFADVARRRHFMQSETSFHALCSYWGWFDFLRDSPGAGLEGGYRGITRMTSYIYLLYYPYVSYYPCPAFGCRLGDGRNFFDGSMETIRAEAADRTANKQASLGHESWYSPLTPPSACRPSL